MTVFILILRTAIAALFAYAGFKKMFDQPDMALLFSQIGFGKWFQYITGITEIVAAGLLLWPGTVFLGATLVAATMAGAALTNLLVPGIDNALAKFALSVVLFLIASFIAWRTRS